MISKLKEKFLKKEKNNNLKSKININLIIIFFISLISSFFIYKLTNNFILTILCVITIFITLYVLFNQFNNDISKNKELEFYSSFYKNFFYYSTINNSYEIGFKVAIDKLEISNLKDDLNNKIENKDYSQIEPITRKKEEILLIDDLFYNLKNDELINESTFTKTEQLLNSYLKIIKVNNYSNYLLFVLSFFILIVSIITFFSLFK